MSFEIEYQLPDTEDGIVKLKILTREEFAKLDDEEKIEYFASPEDKENEEWTLGVSLFMRSIISEIDPGDLGYPELVDEFIEIKFPSERKAFRSDWKESGYDDEAWEDRTDRYVDFIQNQDDEVIDSFDLFVMEKFYASDFWYGYMLEKLGAA